MTRPIAFAALVAASLSALPVAAQTFRVGLDDLFVPDTARPLEGFVFYPTLSTAAPAPELGNKVWQGVDVIRDATPAEGRFPLVVLSHGMFGNARNQAWLAEGLAERGYVVAAIDHPGTSTFDKDPEARRQLWERPRDITRTIDALIAGAGGVAVDPERVFVGGHSLGGFTAMALAGARFDKGRLDGFCAGAPEDLACSVFSGWRIAEAPQDRAAMEADLADPRIRAFAVFDLGGTQAFTDESLAAVARPVLVYGAPDNVHGMAIETEARALAAALPDARATYLEPAGLSHFDFMGECTERGLAILEAEEPEDAYVCERGTDERRGEHAAIVAEVAAFFGTH